MLLVHESSVEPRISLAYCRTERVLDHAMQLPPLMIRASRDELKRLRDAADASGEHVARLMHAALMTGPFVVAQFTPKDDLEVKMFLERDHLTAARSLIAGDFASLVASLVHAPHESFAAMFLQLVPLDDVPLDGVPLDGVPLDGGGDNGGGWTLQHGSLDGALLPGATGLVLGLHVRRTVSGAAVSRALAALVQPPEPTAAAPPEALVAEAPVEALVVAEAVVEAVAETVVVAEAVAENAAVEEVRVDDDDDRARAQVAASECVAATEQRFDAVDGAAAEPLPANETEATPVIEGEAARLDEATAATTTALPPSTPPRPRAKRPSLPYEDPRSLVMRAQRHLKLKQRDVAERAGVAAPFLVSAWLRGAAGDSETAAATGALLVAWAKSVLPAVALERWTRRAFPVAFVAPSSAANAVANAPDVDADVDANVDADAPADAVDTAAIATDTPDASPDTAEAAVARTAPTISPKRARLAVTTAKDAPGERLPSAFKTRTSNIRADVFVPPGCPAMPVLAHLAALVESALLDAAAAANASRPRFPARVVGTRNSFDFDPVALVVSDGVIDWCIPKAVAPADSTLVPHTRDAALLFLGVSTHIDVIDDDALRDVEARVLAMHGDCLVGRGAAAHRPQTFHHTMRGGHVARTKMFFGARYLWTAKQMAEPDAAVARGIRRDVAPPPRFIVDAVLPALLRRGLVAEHVNQVALNVYETGGEGLAPHFDDAQRFALPVASIRLFSDSRLSFGCRGSWGANNGSFCIPMPRGSVLVLHEGTFAATRVKHSIRTCDMRGRSGVILFRRVHDELMRAALNLEVDRTGEALLSAGQSEDAEVRSALWGALERLEGYAD